MAITAVTRRLGPLAALVVAISAVVAPALAQQASPAQQNAIRQACPADYQAHCANVPPGGKPAFQCLARNLSKLSPPCRRAVAAVTHPPAPGAPSAAVAASGAAPRAAGAAAAQPIPVREELMLLRQSCGGDFRALCNGVPLGGGRAIACLRAHGAELSPQCGAALGAR